MFSSPAQANFMEASFGAYDGNIKPYGSYSLSTPSQSQSHPQSQYTPDSTRSLSRSVSSPSNSLAFGFAGLAIRTPTVHAVEANPVDGSSKRPRVENSDASGSADDEATPPAAVSDRQKKKGQKRVGKRVEPQPLVGMYNDLPSRYDNPISIR